MNWTRWKEMALYGAAMVVSKGAFAGCYPLIPGFFAACYMEEVNRALLVIFTVFGMALFVPVQAMAKYTTVLLVTAAVIRLAEWANKRCSVYVGAGAAAASVFLIAMAGELLQVRNRETVWIGGLESILVCGMVVALSPVLHYFLEGGILAAREADAKQTAPEHGEKLQTYAKSFNGLSQIFSQMERFKNNFEPEEMGKMQQEIAGKICMSCSQCAICWQEESSPMYELFYRMFHSIEKRGSAEEEVHQELSGYCPYSDRDRKSVV